MVCSMVLVVCLVGVVVDTVVVLVSIVVVDWVGGVAVVAAQDSLLCITVEFMQIA